MARVNKTIGPVRSFQDDVPRTFLVTFCEAFITPHLNYWKMIFDYAFNYSFCWKMESVQYDAALATAHFIRGKSKEKLYQELEFETWHSREMVQ